MFCKKDVNPLITLVMDTPGSETPETVHAFYTQIDTHYRQKTLTLQQSRLSF